MNDAPEDDGLGARVAHLPVGVVIRRQPGVTRWAKWAWRAVAVLPGAGPAEWRELRREGEAVEYHAATVTLEVHRTETEGYRVALSNTPPCVYVILRPAARGPHELDVFAVTASAYDAEKYLDCGEEIVEPVPMPPALIAWLSAFIGRHHRDEPFVKRKRKGWKNAAPAESEPPAGEGRGVFRAPTARRRTVH